jgi:hypothetical protein
LAKIAHRLDADQYLFPQGLELVLHDWKPLPNETFKPKQVNLFLTGRPQSSKRIVNGVPKLPPSGFTCLAFTYVSPKPPFTIVEFALSDTGSLITKIDGCWLGRLDTALSLLLVIMALPLDNVFNLPSMRAHLLCQDDFRSAAGVPEYFNFD